MSTNKVDKEQAQNELEDFFREMDIDMEREDPASQKHIDNLRRIAVDAIMAGRVTFTEKNEPVIIPWRAEVKPFTMREPDGSNLMAGGLEENELKAILKVVAEMAQVTSGTLAKLKNPEITILRVFYTFFTA